MGKINGCLKIIGCVLIFAAAKVSAFGQLTSVGIPGLGWVWVFAIGVLGISILGIFAGCSEKELALKIFAGFMVAGMIVMLIFGIRVAVTRNKVRDALTSDGLDTADAFMKEPNFRTMLDSIQSTTQCCGLSSSRNWGSEIPQSCECDASSNDRGFSSLIWKKAECTARPEGTTGPDQIYKMPCGEYLFYVMDFGLKISMGVLFGFAVTALLGLLVTLLMLHQVNRQDGGAPAMSMKNY